MLVTLPSQILSNFFSIPGLYAKILSFSTKSPVLYAEVLHFYADNYIFGFHCTGHLHGLIIVLYLLFVFNYRTHAMCGRGGGGQGNVGGDFSRTSVCANLFWRKKYCAKPRPDTKSHHGYWSCRVIGRHSPPIMW